MSGKVQSVERALSILEALSHSGEGLRIIDISKRVNLHKSTTHRLLNTLIQMGYVKQDVDTNRYSLTLKLFEMANRRIADLNIVDISKPYAKKLVKKVNEIVHIVVRDNDEIVYVDKVEANNIIRMASNIGKRSPIYSTSVGKAILAELPKDEMLEILNRIEYKKMTDNTITSKRAMLKEIQQTKERRYAIDDEENELGIRCVGAAILNRDGKVEGAISISGPSFRITDDNIHKLGKKVYIYANLISEELGYIGPEA